MKHVHLLVMLYMGLLSYLSYYCTSLSQRSLAYIMNPKFPGYSIALACIDWGHLLNSMPYIPFQS